MAVVIKSLSIFMTNWHEKNCQKMTKKGCYAYAVMLDVLVTAHQHIVITVCTQALSMLSSLQSYPINY